MISAMDLSCQACYLSSIELISRFTYIFLVSAILVAFIGFPSALLFKYVDLRRMPLLEFALLLLFAYLPYGLAENIGVAGEFSVDAKRMMRFRLYDIKFMEDTQLQNSSFLRNVYICIFGIGFIHNQASTPTSELHENRITMHWITGKMLNENCSGSTQQFSADEKIHPLL
ncbi:Sodium/hydrogen exchanger [Dirofilaria immitis]|nr:Sodium/hydrogen exchanger [Dirofilaria immitis]